MSETRHTVDPRFTYLERRTGKEVVLYVGLLDAAHRAGLVAIETDILQYPHPENDQTCIVRATVVFERDPERPLRFSGIGDANPQNVGKNIAPHYIRMAETRAKARALRDALNVGMLTAEELGDEDAQDHSAAQAPKAAPARQVAPVAAPQPRRDVEAPAPATDASVATTPARLTWTDVWSVAKAQGIHDREALAKALGGNPATMDPGTILVELRAIAQRQPA